MKRERYSVGQEIWEVETVMEGGTLQVIKEGEAVTFPVAGVSGSTVRLRLNNRTVKAVIHKHKDDVYIHLDGHVFQLKKFVGSAAEMAQASSFDGNLKPPMPGNVVKILVSAGDTVEKDQPLVIIESMKMEHPVSAPCDGEVKTIHVREGELAEIDRVLLEMTTGT